MKECPNENCCENRAHSMLLKICQFCKKVIEGAFCKLCIKCSKILNECGHCRTTLVDEE